jgi:hypothetical protein
MVDKDGQFLCAKDVKIGRWDKPKNVYSVHIDNPVTSERSQIFLFGNEKGKFPVIGFDKNGKGVVSQNYYVSGSGGSSGGSGGSSGGSGGGDSGGPGGDPGS